MTRENVNAGRPCDTDAAAERPVGGCAPCDTRPKGALRIGDVELSSPFLAAPLAGVTDAAFRGILAEMGASLTTTEMVSGKGLLYRNKKTEELLRVWPTEEKTACQIFGGEPEVMAETAKLLRGTPHQLLDINMGCPVPKVVRNGEGSALLKDLDRLYDVTKAVCENAGRPVTVKIRTGWDEEHIVCVEAAKAAEAAGCAAVTVHGRTREQFYQGRADRRLIAEVKKAVSVPVTGNGDIFTATDAVAMMKETGCDMVMIARGMLGNPWIFREARALWEEGAELPPPTMEERKAVMEDHLARVIAEKGEHRGVQEMRKHIGWYIKGIPGAAALRRRANSLETAADLTALLGEL